MCHKIILFFSFLLFPFVAFSVDYTQDANCEAAYLVESDHSPGTTIVDSTSNGLDGAAEGADAPNWNNASPPAAYSDGYVDFTDDYIRVTSTVFDQLQLSLVVWHDYTTNPSDADRFYINKSATSQRGFQIVRRSTGDRHAFLFDDASLDLLEGGPDIDLISGWHHYGWVVDRTETGTARLVFYFDGVSQAISSASDTFTGSGTNGIFYIGQDGDGSNSVNGMSWDEFGYFSRLLSSTEVNDIIDNGLFEAAAGARRTWHTQ